KEEAAPAPITVRVCQSLSCSLQGGDKLLTALAAKVNGDWAGRVRAVAAPCMGHCDHAAVAAVGKSYCYDATVEKIEQKIQKGETEADRLSTITLAEFTASEMKGDWLLQQLRHLKEGKKYGETVMAGLMAANLRGLGGAGFPTAKKWQIVRGFPGPRLMAVNIDEGEPGTFKDYFYLKQNPYRFILGMLVAAELVGVEKIYIYLRDEYPDIYLLLQRALAETRAAGWFGAIGCELRRGAGAYICGEESAMLESIEGKRGLPRHRPPFVAQVGLFGRPTLVNNLETLYWVPEIILKGPDWWNSFGRHERRGLRSYSLSGRVKNPGVKLAPAGITVQELIDEYGGGMADGHGFKAYLPGGASGGILPATMANIPLDFDTLQPHGCFIGSAAVIILSDQDNLADAALNLIEFFKDESCGQCTPCRVGTEKAMTLMQQRRWHKDLLQELTSVMSDASICGLGQAAMNPVVSVMKHFPDDFESQS
ncbi:MAG: NAD(P)H-dependent oxidoreductase subunit E, partial [Alphaproteobacteria bacterium]|nr:NAD(P)H-dependent oxidoreductase subunit E [Alphaproteobacteria bacterium]